VSVPEPIVITPTGDLDVATVTDFEDALSEAAQEAGERMIIDLSAIDFIDSSGLSVILQVNERLRQERRSLAVVAPRGTAAAVLLTLTGLRRSLAVFESRGAALRRR
jgi:anti-sigma B factor antagonist